MKKLVLILLLLGSTLSGCKKDEVVSFGQQTASKIQAELSSSTSTSTRIARVFIGTAQVNSGLFGFDGDFVVVEGARYNLNRLISYQVFSSGNLTLYF